MRTLNRRQQLAAAALTAVALLFISLDFAGGSLAGARGGATGALGSLYRGTDSVIGPVRRFVQGVPDVSSNRATIASLRDQNDTLRRELADAKVDAATAAQLKALQLQANSADWPIMPARVIATGPGSGFEWTVMVDAGTADHIQTGQTVTDGVGLVGRVLAVQKNTSTVLLAADPTSAVGVRDSRSGALLLATGASAAGLTAMSLASGSDVRVGDQLLTGPAGVSTYAPGVAVGVVTSVRTTQEATVSATVRPLAPQTGLNVVGIVSLPVTGVPRSPLTPASG